jgi:hypothetical protein
VLRLLLDAGRIDEQRVELILGWGHTSGFSVHNEVVVQAGDGEGLERLARYLARPPVSLQRMEWDREKGEVLYRTGRGHAEERGSDQERADDVRNDVERIDELEFLARVVTQLPEPRTASMRQDRRNRFYFLRRSTRNRQRAWEKEPEARHFTRRGVEREMLFPMLSYAQSPPAFRRLARRRGS